MPPPILHASHLRTARDAGLRALWWREYEKPHFPFRAVTSDGVELRGVHLRDGFSRLVIYCHGFLSGKNYLHVQHWVESLAEAMDVIAFDFRGHGESGGATTMGEYELLDLDAVMQYALQFDYERIFVMGSSMGGAVTIRYAAQTPEVDGIITMGAFAHKRFSASARAGFQILRLPLSRHIIRWSYATRIERAQPPYNPSDFISSLCPRPVLIIHGEYDPLIPLSHARELYAKAGEPKALYVIPRGGHDLENLNAQTKMRILEWMQCQ